MKKTTTLSKQEKTERMIRLRERERILSQLQLITRNSKLLEKEIDGIQLAIGVIEDLGRLSP